MFHTHKWTEESRWFIAPYTRPFEATRASEEFMKKVMYGITAVELRCQSCGDLKHMEFTGDCKKDKNLVPGKPIPGSSFVDE